MDWPAYGSFLLFALLLTVVPGPDFAVVTRNTLVAGRHRGAWCAAGVTTSNLVQGITAAAGLGALIVRAQPVFTVIRWAGVAYLAFLGAQAIRSAVRGDCTPLYDGGRGSGAWPIGVAFGGWRQGFLSNITNPKVLVFYLAVLPQFLPPDAGVPVLVLFAITHAALGLGYLLLLTVSLHRTRRWLTRRSVRRALDAVTGMVLLGFGARLAAERV
ncbi:MAG TPA: LysE family translocator [Candidatus Dormibacteraeota bacterium]|nr:LysE family translocator [Candidatus Dormibacteraeota bacterium]